MTTRISFVRHGEVDNPQDVYYGRLPGFGLSTVGRFQAEQAASYLARPTNGMPPPAALYTSPMRRAQQTAATLVESLPHLSPQISTDLSEVFTPFDGQPRARMMARNWDFYTNTEPPYEQPIDVVARARRFVALARTRFPEQHVVAVTHGDLITFLLLWAMGQPVEQRSKANVAQLGIEDGYPAPASLSVFRFETADEGERPQIEYLRPYD